MFRTNITRDKPPKKKPFKKMASGTIGSLNITRRPPAEETAVATPLGRSKSHFLFSFRRSSKDSKEMKDSKEKQAESQGKPRSSSFSMGPMTARYASRLSGVDSAEYVNFRRAIWLFNVQSAKKAVDFLLAEGCLDTNEDIGTFLWECQELDKVTLGSFLGSCDKDILNAYVNHVEFQYLDFDLALRRFLYCFRLPGEAEKIDRLMNAFSQRYYEFHPNFPFKSAGEVYRMAFSAIMLNTDIHNPNNIRKMSENEFITNCQGVDHVYNFDLDFLSELYHRIVGEEIKLTTAGALFPEALKKGWLHLLVKGKLGKRWKKCWVIFANKKLHFFSSMNLSKLVLEFSLEQTRCSFMPSEMIKNRKFAVSFLQDEPEDEEPLFLSGSSECDIGRWVVLFLNLISSCSLIDSPENELLDQYGVAVPSRSKKSTTKYARILEKVAALSTNKVEQEPEIKKKKSKKTRGSELVLKRNSTSPARMMRRSTSSPSIQRLLRANRASTLNNTCSTMEHVPDDDDSTTTVVNPMFSLLSQQEREAAHNLLTSRTSVRELSLE